MLPSWELTCLQFRGMSAMKVIDLKQRSKEWLKWRSKGITASDVPIILGLSPYKTPWQLWAEKIGKINAPDISNNPHVKRGNRLEDTIRLLAESRYGEILLPMCGECAEWDVLRASFDGLNSLLHPFEFKSPSDSIWEDVKEKGTASSSYIMYEAQVHAQCIVAGVSTGQLIFYHEDGRDLDFTVTLTPERKSEIIAAADIFHEAVITGKAPPTDPERDWYIPETKGNRFVWESNSDLWRLKNHRIKALKEKLKALENEQAAIQGSMIALMGPFRQADFGGVKITRYIKRGSIDYPAYLKDVFPDKEIDDELEVYRKSAREEVRFYRSEDELVNMSVDDVITSVKSGYF